MWKSISDVTDFNNFSEGRSRHHCICFSDSDVCVRVLMFHFNVSLFEGYDGYCGVWVRPTPVDAGIMMFCKWLQWHIKLWSQQHDGSEC